MISQGKLRPVVLGGRLDPTLVIARFISDDRFGKFLFLIFVNQSVTSVHLVRKAIYILPSYRCDIGFESQS